MAAVWCRNLREGSPSGSHTLVWILVLTVRPDRKPECSCTSLLSDQGSIRFGYKKNGGGTWKQIRRVVLISLNEKERSLTDFDCRTPASAQWQRRAGLQRPGEEALSRVSQWSCSRRLFLHDWNRRFWVRTTPRTSKHKFCREEPSFIKLFLHWETARSCHSYPTIPFCREEPTALFHQTVSSSQEDSWAKLQEVHGKYTECVLCLVSCVTIPICKILWMCFRMKRTLDEERLWKWGKPWKWRRHPAETLGKSRLLG